MSCCLHVIVFINVGVKGYYKDELNKKLNKLKYMKEIKIYNICIIIFAVRRIILYMTVVNIICFKYET